MHAEMHANSTCMELPLSKRGALITFQKRDGHIYTYIHIYTTAYPWPTVHDRMPHTYALGNKFQNVTDPVFNGSEDSLPQET